MTPVARYRKGDDRSAPDAMINQNLARIAISSLFDHIGDTAFSWSVATTD